MRKPKEIIYIVSGSICLVLGAVGIFVPLLPTTPFWLLTCWFYVRSSAKLYDRVMRNKYFGTHVKSYLVDKSIPLRNKIVITATMWLSMILSCIFLVDKLWMRLLLVLTGIGIMWHILSFPTRKNQ